MINEIIQGSALEKLKELESESVHCCITSPPYWALRDYKIEGQLGLEPTFTEYITKLIEIFNEVKRILKPSGSCWVNMGDTYNGVKTGNTNGSQQGNPFMDRPAYHDGIKNEFRKQRVSTIPEKSLCLIPQRFQISMLDQGWICRNTVIWHKPNCMPSSARDRFTIDFEYLFFFVKNQKYYFDTQYEPLLYKENNNGRVMGGAKYGGVHVQNKKPLAPFGGNKHDGYENATYSGKPWEPSPLGRIKRSVWKISTEAFLDAHFAVSPSELVETPIKATCPEYVCKKCGRAREKILGPAKYKPVESYGDKWRDSKDNILRNMKALRDIQGEHDNIDWSREVIGLSDCNCNAGYDAGIVLDPFLGSGTTAIVAMQNARNFLGIELNPEYIKMAYERLDPLLKQERLQI